MIIAIGQKEQHKVSRLICENCGGETNTAVAEYIDRLDRIGKFDGKADKCYLKFVDGEWVEGCAYKEAEGFDKHFANKILTERKEKDD